MTKLTIVEKVLAAREAGNVRRCHVVPHIGEYTDGKHSYDAVHLLLVLKPDASRELIIALLYHDNGERWVGDMPSTAKWWTKDLGAEYKKAEDLVLDTWEQKATLGELSELELKWLRAVDQLELWLWTHDQEAFGNQHSLLVRRNLETYWRENPRMLPEKCWDFIRLFHWQRLPERPGEHAGKAYSV
jgi:5'-deoxynucleotidase YfbR-like HD superfamily hydrolase